MRQAFHLMLALIPLVLASAPAARAQAAADPTVYMIRYIEVMPAAQEKVAGLLKQLADASRKEAGSARFDMLQRAAPANHFATFEVWKDQASLDAHVAGAHKQFLEAAQSLLIAPVDDRLCIGFDTAPASSAAGSALYATHQPFRGRRDLEGPAG
jgi:quinol monooxygenase YgiN